MTPVSDSEAEPPVTEALPTWVAPSLNCTVPATVPAATVTPAARSTFCTPPVAVSVVVLEVAAIVEVTRVDCDVVNWVLSVGTKVARSGWSPLTRSLSVTEALPAARALVPTRTPLSRNSTEPAGVPDVAVTPAVSVADRPVTTEPRVVVVVAATGAVPDHVRPNAPTPAAEVR